MRHLSSIALSVFLLVGFAVQAQQQVSFYKPCIERRSMEQPSFAPPNKDIPSFDKPQFEKPAIEFSQSYKLDREAPEIEKATFDKPGFENRCPTVQTPVTRERSYTTQSASTVALKRKDLNYNLPREGRIYSRKVALKNIKPGSLAAASCGCPTTRPGAMGSGLGLVVK